MDIGCLDIARAAQLKQGRTIGDEIYFLCPRHDDNDPSLRVNSKKNYWFCDPCTKGGNAWALAAFLAGCECEDKPAVRAWMKDHGLLDGRQDQGRRIVATYPYVDMNRDLLFEVVRYDPKDFRQRRPDGNGGWIWNLSGVRRVLYHLPEISRSRGVFVVEGEKDADRILQLGLPATTNAGGAGKWLREYTEMFQAHQTVVIIPDNDEAGRKHAQQVAAAVHRKVASVRILELPGLPEKGDVSDWLEDREPAEAKNELKRLALNAPEWEPGLQQQKTQSRSAPVENERPLINAAIQDLKEGTALALDALVQANRPAFLFRRGATAVRIETDEDGAPVIRELTLDRLRHELARAADYWVAHGKEKEQVPAMPPVAVCRDVLASPDLPFPPVARIVEAPVFAADGTLQLEPGYHQASRTYYAPVPGFSIPTVPVNPSDKDMCQAMTAIEIEMLGDFPFVSPIEKAHAVGLFLLPPARDLISGPTPLHLVEKPSPGTGAGLLIDVLSFPWLGRNIGAMVEGRDEDEWRKRVTAKLASGPPYLFIDNLRRRLDSASISAALAAQAWEDRRLGQSETVLLPIRCAWIATGNNPALSAEITRRTIRIRLDAGQDRPWLRTGPRNGEGFRHPDLRSWVRENRAILIWSALVLIRRWIAEGRPKPPGLPTLGTFESWSEVIGGILATAHIKGFLGNLEEFYETSDAEGAAWRTFVQGWWNRFQKIEVGVADLFSFADILDLGEGKTERSQRTKLGKLLSAARDRWYGDFQIAKGGIRDGNQLWRLKLRG